MKMRKEEFHNNLKLAINEAIKRDGDSHLMSQYMLHYKGSKKYKNLSDVVNKIYRDHLLCPMHIDLGLLKRTDINEIFIRISGYEFVSYREFSDCEYNLPIYFMGRERPWQL